MKPKTKSEIKAIEEGCYFDETEPLKIKRFIETHCRLPDSTSNHKIGDKVTLIPWTYEDIIKGLYGWRRPDGSQLRHRGCCFCCKKQSKSFLLACLAIYELMKQPASAVYLISSRVETASHIFDYASKIIQQSPALDEKQGGRLHIQPHTKIITDKGRPAGQQGFLKVMSSDKGAAQGQNASAVFWDEIAIVEDRKVWSGFYHSTIARDGIQFSISTPQDSKTTIGYEQYQYAKQILDGDRIDTEFLPVIYGVPEDVDYTDPENWWQHIPSIGVTVSKHYYLKEWEAAQDNARKVQEFRTLLLGQWVESLDAWITDKKWDACFEDFKESDFYGTEVIVGIDPAQNSLSCYVLIAEKDGKLYLMPRFFIPKDTANNEIKKRTDCPYVQWEQDGYCTLTDGDTSDPAALRRSLMADAEKFRFKVMGYDANFSESRLLLMESGFDPVEVKGNRNIVGPATNLFENMVSEGRLRHNGHPILRWNALNAVPDKKGKLLLINSDKSRGRYDGISATITGLKLWLDIPKYFQTDVLFVPA